MEQMVSGGSFYVGGLTIIHRFQFPPRTLQQFNGAKNFYEAIVKHATLCKDRGNDGVCLGKKILFYNYFHIWKVILLCFINKISGECFTFDLSKIDVSKFSAFYWAIFSAWSK